MSILWMKLTLQCQWWTSFWRVCELVTSGIQSVKEGNPAKANSLSEASCENLSLSPLPQMFPPFTTSLIDNLSARHIKDLAAASQPSRTNRPPHPRQPISCCLIEGGWTSEPKASTCCWGGGGSVKSGHVKAQKEKSQKSDWKIID